MDDASGTETTLAQKQRLVVTADLHYLDFGSTLLINKENLILDANVISPVKGANGDNFCLHLNLALGRQELVPLLEAMGTLAERLNVDLSVEFVILKREFWPH